VYGFIEKTENVNLGKAAGEWLHSVKILDAFLSKTTFIVGN